MSTTLEQRLRSEGLLSRIVFSDVLSALTKTITLDPPTALGPPETGEAHLQFTKQPLGIFDIDLSLPSTQLPYVLAFEKAGTQSVGFRFAVALDQQSTAKPLFGLVASVPDLALVAAQPRTEGDQELLDPIPNERVSLQGVGIALVIKGKAGEAASCTLSPSLQGPDGLVTLRLSRGTVLIGKTGFGLDLSDGVVLDDTPDAAMTGPASLDGQPVATPADKPTWRGIAVRKAKLYLPPAIPFLGGHTVQAYFEIGQVPTPGIDLAVTAHVPKLGSRPEITVLIECHDPTVTGISGFVPTLVEASMVLPLAGNQQTFGDASQHTVTFAAGTPVTVRAQFAREPHAKPPSSRLSLAISAQGPDGILSVSSDTGGAGAKAVVTAAALATALIADKGPPGADASGIVLHVLLTAAMALSSVLKKGKVVVHGVELISEGSGLPIGGKAQFKIDYSVDVSVVAFNVGVLAVEMSPDQPMRIRAHEVVLTIDPAQAGLKMITLDYTKASLDIEDPGNWRVKGPNSLFDVLGTRSGRGSVWIEVDLRFKLDLGPVKVGGATIRGTLDDTGQISASLRGLDVSLALSPMIDGEGKFQLLQPDGFDVHLAAHIQPLGVAADATVSSTKDMVKLALSVDLPGPIPLAATGLGIFGLGGMFAINGRPAPAPAGEDPVHYQLRWNYRDPPSFVPDHGTFTFGLEAVIATAPDLGFSFSARAGLFLTTPDVAVRGAVGARMLSPRATLVRTADIAVGLNATGVVVIDQADGVTIGIDGEFDIPLILHITVPIGARFPKSSDDWYIYFGADGPNAPIGQGREIGPVRAIVLPHILDQEADAYLMLRGHGIAGWPRGLPASGDPKGVTIPDGFIIAFGFGFQFILGVKPLLWAEVHARADVLAATHPVMLCGLGEIGGSLNIGPASVGVDAHLAFDLMPNHAPYLFARLCGHIDLFFFSLSGCVQWKYHNEPKGEVPLPDEHPLDRIEGAVRGHAAFLVDERYRKIADLATDLQSAPMVWADAIILLGFSTAPKLALAPAQFLDPPKVATFGYPEGDRAHPLGSRLLTYEWTLTDVGLFDVTHNPAGDPVAGPLSWAWLDGKFGAAGGQPQPAELVLLTPQPDIWVDRLSDAGASLPNDPIDNRARICQTTSAATVGWALGSGAVPTAGGFTLLTDPVSPDPLQSEVHAAALTLCSRFSPLNIYTAQHLPPPLSFVPPRLATFVTPIELERSFIGYLDLGRVEAPPNCPADRLPLRFFQGLRITLDDELFAARLWIVVLGDMWRLQLDIRDVANGAWQVTDARLLATGVTALRYAPMAGDPASVTSTTTTPPASVSAIQMSWSIGTGTGIGIVGVGGITRTARNAAAVRNKARADDGRKLGDAAQDGPPPPDNVQRVDVRNVLEPGHVYRIDVRMTWTGTLSLPDAKPITRVSDPADGFRTDRQYYFRTTPAPVAAPAGPPGRVAAAFGEADRLSFLFTQQTLFQPEMLERHLIGLEPRQGELNRFMNDPLRAHFSVGHIAVLADRYGYALKLGLQRVDRGGVDGRQQTLSGILTAIDEARIARGADSRRIEIYSASPCKLPLPGATLTADVALAPEAWYETYVLALSKTPGISDGRLPGVSFRTSRWRAPADMLNDLQFRAAGFGVSSGDIELRTEATPTPQVVEGEDAAFERALNVLGLDGWPQATAPRISILWRRDAGQDSPTWSCAGILLESPEPIHRVGRLEIQDLKLEMGAGASPGSLDIRRRDRAGTRLLFVTTTPFHPVMWRTTPVFSRPHPPALVLMAIDKPIGKAPTTLMGRLRLPLAPSFAEEAA